MGSPEQNKGNSPRWEEPRDLVTEMARPVPPGPPPTSQGHSGLLGPSTRYPEDRSPPGRGRNDASRVLGEKGGSPALQPAKSLRGLLPQGRGYEATCLRPAVSVRAARLSWPRTSVPRGSWGSCPPAAPRGPRPWPEPPSGRPGWWRSRRGGCPCGARGRPAA